MTPVLPPSMPPSLGVCRGSCPLLVPPWPAALPARQPSAAVDVLPSVRDQQPQLRFASNALLAGERNAVGFGGFIGIGSGKSDGHHLAFSNRPFAERRRMLLIGHFALPFAVSRRVGAIGIKERVAPAQRTIPHYHDALIAALNAVKHLHGDIVEAVPDHDTRLIV